MQRVGVRQHPRVVQRQHRVQRAGRCVHRQRRGGIFRHGMPDGATRFDPAEAARLSAATGEWQTIEIEAVGERLTVRLNGELLTEAQGVANPEGYIGLQSELGAMEVRAIEIEELDSPRPNSHDLARSVIDELHGKLERVVVTDLRGSTYYATLTIRSGNRNRMYDWLTGFSVP